MKVKIIIVLISIIKTALPQENNSNDVPSSLFMKIIETRSKIFYRINFKIHSITNKLFLSLKLNKDIRKSNKFQILLKSHLYFNNKAQNYYNVYEKLSNASYENLSQKHYKNLDYTVQNIIEEKFDRVRNGLKILLPDFNVSDKLYHNRNETEVNIWNNTLKGLTDRIIEYIIDPILKDQTNTNNTESISENVLQDINALEKLFKILSRFETKGQENIAIYKDDVLNMNHKNNITNMLENLVKDEIQIMVTKLANMTLPERRKLLDIFIENETEVANITLNETVEKIVLSDTDNAMGNIIDQIINDVKTPNATGHAFNDVTLSADELRSILFPTNASSDAPIETRRVYKGRKTRVRNYPFLASLHLASEFLCAGSIISVDLVLTAASCLQIAHKNEGFRKDPRTIFVRVGSDFTKRSGKLIPIVEVIFHPKYDSVTLRNNLAIARMLKKLKHTNERKIKKIKYDKEANVLKNNVRAIKILGWGARHEKQKIVGVQRPSVARLDIYDINDCKEIYSKYYVTDTNFCAGFTTKGGGACMGDVGGPAVVSKKLIGVVSFGPTVCGMSDAPTVFTKVGFYSDWINDVIHKIRVNQSTENPEAIQNSPTTVLQMIPTTTTTFPLYQESARSSPPDENPKLVSVNPNNKQDINPVKNHDLDSSQEKNIERNQNKNAENSDYENRELNEGQKSLMNENSQSSLHYPNNFKDAPLKLKHKTETAFHDISRLNLSHRPVLKMNHGLGQSQKFVPYSKPRIKTSLTTLIYRNPQVASEQKYMPSNNIQNPKNMVERVISKVDDDEMNIIKQVIQDFILSNDTVIDYLTNEKVLDDLSEQDDNKSDDVTTLMSEPENNNKDNLYLSKQQVSHPILRSVPSKSLSNSITTPVSGNSPTKARSLESYFDGKPTEIATFVESIEFPNDDASSYYEVEIPIEDTPFKKQTHKITNENRMSTNNYDNFTRTSITNIIYVTRGQNYSKNRSDNIFHKVPNHQNKSTFDKKQNYKSFIPKPIFNQSFNVYHKDTDEEIGEENGGVAVLRKDENRFTSLISSTNKYEKKTTEDTVYEIKIESNNNNDNSVEFEQENLSSMPMAIAGSISQEDFNYVYDKEQETELRAQENDEYYDFDFVLDYDSNTFE